MKPLADCLLYAFVDAAYLDGRDSEVLCRQLCDGGADLIQLRAKDWPVDDIAQLAKRLAPITVDAGVRLVINDHPDIAAEVGAPTAHLGQEDFFDAGHRQVDEVKPSGSTLELGLSTHSPEQAVRACDARADYVAIGPVFATPTKPGRPPVTLDYVSWAATNIDRPWFAIAASILTTSQTSSPPGHGGCASSQRCCARRTWPVLVANSRSAYSPPPISGSFPRPTHF